MGRFTAHRIPVAHHVSAAASAALALLGASLAHADVTLKEHMAVEGQGIMSMANMSGTTTVAVSGTRARTESDLQMQSRLVRMFAHGAGQSVEIVRLDEDKTYELFPAKKQYKETSLAERRAQLEQAAAQAKDSQAKQPSPTGMDESECEWSDPTADVERTGQKATIGGFAAEQVTVVTKQSCKNKKTGAVCDVALYLDEWLAPGFDGGDELRKYHMAYAQKMGLVTEGRAVTDRAEALFGRYKSAWAQVVDKMKGLKGYPVKTTFAMGFGGPQCQGGESTQTASDSGNDSSSSPPAPGGLAGQIASSLFRRKKPHPEEPAPSAAPEPALPASMSGMIVPLKVKSELLSVSHDGIAADAFEVPAGFKKVD